MLLSIFQGIDPIAQRILSIGLIAIAAGTVIGILILIGKKILKFNFKGVKTGQNSENGIFILTPKDFSFLYDIVMDSVIKVIELNRIDCLKEKMKFAKDKLKFTQSEYEKIYYQMAKSKHNLNYLEENEDYLHFKEIIKNIIFSDDENRISIKSLLREKVVDLTALSNREEIEKYTNDFVELSIEHARVYINEHYKSRVTMQDGEYRNRMIGTVEIFNVITSNIFKDRVFKNMEKIFLKGKEIEDIISEKRKEIERKAKGKIEKIYRPNGDKKGENNGN